MQTIKELAYIVTKNKLKSIEILGANSNVPSRIAEFYDGVASNRFETDDEAALHFYNAAASDRNYHKFKSTLKKRLINTLFFIDVKQNAYNDRQRAYYECYKDWAAANILFGKNAHASGIELCLRILKYSIKFEFTGLALDVMRMLRLHYGTREGNLKKYNHYKRLCKTYEPIIAAEKEAEELYSDLIINYVNNKSTKKAMSSAAAEAYEQLKEALATYDAYNLHLYGALIQLMVHTSINDYAAALKTCEKVITVFENKSYAANTPLQIAYYQQLVCYTQLRKYDEGRLTAQKCIKLIDTGSFNWFKYHELYLILAFHTQQYEEAFITFNQVIKHKRFKFLPESIQEIWKIFEAYLYYLLSTDIVKPSDNTKRFTKFRAAKFINETPIFAKDKAGLNIAILAIQILFLIQQKKYTKVFDKAEAIDKYCSRYLKKEETIRSYYFIKMLLAIQAGSFHKVAVVRKATPFLKKLESYPFEVANQNHNIDIIPYETLWEYALSTLDSK